MRLMLDGIYQDRPFSRSHARLAGLEIQVPAPLTVFRKPRKALGIDLPIITDLDGEI